MKNWSSLHNTILFVAFIFLTEFTVHISSNVDDTGEPNLNDIGERIAHHIPSDLPPLPINMSNLPEKEAKEATKRLKEKCEATGGPGAYERLQAEAQDLAECASGLVNITELEMEIEQAKPLGDLDTVFRKYCQRKPILTNCVTNMSYAMDLCLEDKEKVTKEIFQNITEALLDFLCFKEGDRIALFIAEGGVECIQSKSQEIQECMNQTLGVQVQEELGSLQGGAMPEVPLLVIGEKECRSYFDLQQCVVDSLEKCDEPTPANIVESLFHFVVKMLPCTPQSSTRSGAGSIFSISSAIVFSSALAILARF